MSSGRDPAAGPRLTSIRWGRSSCPLTAPYALSFTTLTSFESIWIAIADDRGAVGVGEAVALPGYGDETADSVAAAVERLIEGAVGGTPHALRARCEALLPSAPFAASAVLTALDVPDYLDHCGTAAAFPLNAPVAGDADAEALACAIDRAIADGCRHIKAKVGRNVERECANAWTLLTRPAARDYHVVFDANQAYSVDAALTFAAALADDPLGRLSWFEQPVARHDWDAMAQVCRASAVPIVLDECIHSAADVDRAAAIGAAGVKLKGFKNGGIAAALALAALARSLGLTVVFGNGVATDVGNFAEWLTMCAAESLFTPPAESSGFAKLRAPLCELGLGIDAEYRMTCHLDPGAARERLRSFHDSAGR